MHLHPAMPHSEAALLRAGNTALTWLHAHCWLVLVRIFHKCISYLSLQDGEHLSSAQKLMGNVDSFVAGLYRSVQAHHSQSRREVSSLQQQQDPGALYDFNLDEELEMDLDEETMEAMFGQDLASDTDILGMWIPEVLDWPTWVCDFRAAITILRFRFITYCFE